MDVYTLEILILVNNFISFAIRLVTKGKKIEDDDIPKQLLGLQVDQKVFVEFTHFTLM